MGCAVLVSLAVAGLSIHDRKTLALAPGSEAFAQDSIQLPKLLVAVDPSLWQASPRLSAALLESLPVVASRSFAQDVTAPASGPLRFVSATGAVLPGGAALPSGTVRLLPVSAGQGTLRLREGLRRVDVLGITALVAAPQPRPGAPDEPVQVARYLALSRELPPELALSAQSASREPEAVSFELKGQVDALPNVVQVYSFDAEGQYIDALRDVPLQARECGQHALRSEGSGGANVAAAETDIVCARTAVLRLVTDQIERNHPAVTQRSLIATVGGSVQVQIGPEGHRAFWVGAPAGIEPSGPGRYLFKMRARVLNMQRGGPPAVGADSDEAMRIVADEMESAARVWGQCGFSLGPRQSWDIQVVDPPQLALLEVGCAGGVRASGGQVELRVDGKRVSVRTQAGQTPEAVALRLAAAVEKKGFSVRLYRNAQEHGQGLPTFDLVVRDNQGRDVSVSAVAGGPLSNDSGMQVCLARLDLADGLEHFNDFNAAAGTLEERLLLRALMDQDDATIDLIVVPIFGGTGRIGESFIRSAGGSLENALLLDRAGIRAGARSLTLAHELGHILLEMPGHPDDFGVDTPTSLMDADAADATIFGPRRLTLEDCQRALLQAGRKAPVQLLFDWPLPLHEPPKTP